MLQLIGWLGCTYLVVKVLGYMADPALRKEDGEMVDAARLAVWIGFGGAAIFALAILAQGFDSAPGLDFSGDGMAAPAIDTGSTGTRSEAYWDCMSDAGTTLEDCEKLD